MRSPTLQFRGDVRLIITQTPEPIEISETRVYMDRGLTMATFGLMDGANQNRQKKLLQLPDSLRVALYSRTDLSSRLLQETLHAQLVDERCRIGVSSQGWTVDKTDLPGVQQGD